MKLPIGLGNLDFGDWVKGMVAAFIGGGASAVTSGIVVSLKDPTHYNPGTKDFYELVLSVFAMSGLVSLMAFLRTKPVPDTITTTAHIVETSPSSTTDTTIKKVENVSAPISTTVTTNPTVDTKVGG